MHRSVADPRHLHGGLLAGLRRIGRAYAHERLQLCWREQQGELGIDHEPDGTLLMLAQRCTLDEYAGELRQLRG